MRMSVGLLLVGLVAGCNTKAKQMESVEKFNTFALKQAVEEFSKQLADPKVRMLQPDDLDHPAQMAMDACRGKPYEAEMKKIHDLVVEVRELSTARAVDRKKVSEKFEELKVALAAFEKK